MKGQVNTLVSALVEAEVFDGRWGHGHIVLKRAVEPSDFLSSADIDRWLEASLLKWPYFTLLRHGELPAVGSYTTVRDVITQKRGGFPNAAAIRREMGNGASVKLNKLSDWHRQTRDLIEQLATLVPAAVASYVFWTPPESRGMLPHRDAAHVVAVQLEGVKEWHLYTEPGQIASTAGLDVDASQPTHVLLLEPGDVLYLPHGWPHDAVTRDASSLHLSLTLTEPQPEDLIEAFLRRFTSSGSDLMTRHHTRTLEAKSAEVREALRTECTELTSSTWIDSALQAMREKVG